LLSRTSSRLLFSIAVGAVLVAALGLAGCGRKGGLDPPPGVSAVAVDPQQVREPEIGPDGRPVTPPPPVPAPPPQKRWTPIDWLIN
jgi:predicted small lipoprotein YifL